MNLDITNKNLYLLLPGKVSRVAQIYAHEHHVRTCSPLSRIYRRTETERKQIWE